MDETTKPAVVTNTSARTLVFALVAVAFAAVVAVISIGIGQLRAEREIGRLASTALAANTRIKEAINTGQIDRANREIDVQMFENLVLMSLTHESNLGEADYARQALRSIGELKRVWLRFPPKAVDEATNNFVESICRKSESCPKESILQ